MKLDASISAILLGSSAVLAFPLIESGGETTSVSKAAVTVPAGPDNTACAVAAAAQASLASDPSNVEGTAIPAELAVDCLNSIPINKDDATALVQAYKLYVEVQSDLPYLKNPPEGYCNPSFDWLGWLDRIQDNIDSDAYPSETAFQTDLYYGLFQTYDGHVAWGLDILTGMFSFALDPDMLPFLASVSADGIALPEVYFLQDLVVANSNDSTLQPQTDYTASPVKLINGLPASNSVAIQGLQAFSQDPDSRYNSMIASLGKIAPGQNGLFFSQNVPPSDGIYQYEFTLANGTVVEIPIVAVTQVDLSVALNGTAAYENFAYWADLWQLDNSTEAAPSSSAAATSAIVTSTTNPSITSAAATTALASSTATPLPTGFTGYPEPLFIDTYGLAAGYYLTGTNNSNVAVLQVTGFEPSDPNADPSWVTNTTDQIQKFLDGARSDGKTKLIIDLQGNGGGLIDFGTSLFVQIAANVAPNASANMRRSVGMDIVVEAAGILSDNSTNATSNSIAAFNNSPWDFEFDLTPSYYDFNSTEELLDGITYGDDNFTAFFQTNYTNPLLRLMEEEDFSIPMWNASATPLFAAEDIIILTDGYCASTCTTFSEHMKNQFGSEFILVTGRPQTGPGQAVGGIKGSQVFEFSGITSMIQLFGEAPAKTQSQADGTPWEGWGEKLASYLPMARTALAVTSGDYTQGTGSVNGRNSFRIGDTTDTPLQYVYEAADCKVFFTPEMMYDATVLWDRVNEVAFVDRSGQKFTSQYCVSGSTDNPTSISGGWQRGTLGNQSQGKIEAASPIFESAPWANMASNTSSAMTWSKVVDAKSFGNQCSQYTGSKWVVSVLCRVYNAMSS